METFTLSDIITYAFLAIIVTAFMWMCINAIRVRKISNILKTTLDSANPLEALNNESLQSIKELFLKSCNLEIGNNRKSNIPAQEIFTELNIANVFGLNLRALDAGAGTLVGLGLLGTFMGLTLGITGFDSTNSENIQLSIQSLLSGMGTAFITSLFGMGFSIVFTYIEKCLRNNFNKNLSNFCNKLDAIYYIDDAQILSINQKKTADDLFIKLKNLLQYSNSENKEVPIANAIREILANSEDQTKALKSFSSDLALELNDRFDEVMSRQLQEKILPLMDSVDRTTKAVIEHIDQMSANLQSPASDMINSVVEKLKSSMTEIMHDFKTSLSGSATKEIETLAHTLVDTTAALANLPKELDNLASTLQITIDEVKNAVYDISKSTASANDSAMRQVQEQITMTITAVNNAILEVKNVMSNMSQASVRTISNITTGLSEHQNKMELSQSQMIDKFKKLIEQMGDGIERVSSVNNSVGDTLNKYLHVQGEVTRLTGYLQDISNDMKTASEVFRHSQSDFTMKLAEMESISKQKIDNIVNILETAGNTTNEYAEKFEIVKKGLTEIFAQIQYGLKEYSTTIRTSIQSYLDAYTASLTQTTGALASTIQQQNDMVEMLIDTVNSKH